MTDLLKEIIDVDKAARERVAAAQNERSEAYLSASSQKEKLIRDAKENARKAAEELCGLAAAFWKQSGIQNGELALLGSIFHYYAPIRRMVEKRLQALLPQAAVIEPRGSAALGAAKLARGI